MNRKLMASICLLVAVLAQVVNAAPTVSVAPVGVNLSGNHVWSFQITPDFILDPTGPVLIVELALAVDHTDLLDVDVNTLPFDTDFPALNPFTNTTTDGLWLDLPGDRAFASFGSIVFTNPGPVEFLVVETAGSGLTTMRYGVAASGHASNGARITQSTGFTTSQEFVGYTGSVTVPEPATWTACFIASGAFALAWRRWRA
jgi:hypothetical protein